MKRALAVVSALATVLGALWLPAPALAATVRPALLINRDFPDPDVSRFGGTYYAYSTNSGPNVPVATAPEASGPWTVRGDALPQLGAWASGGLTWAPDVSQRADGRYLLYYTARSQAAGRQCIGAALATAPLGPFQPVGTAPLVCNAGEGGDIDPASFVDADGRHYLLYKDDGNAIGQPTSIWLQPVAADGLTFQGGRIELLRNDRSEEAGVIEAPVLVRRASQYVLFYSGGSYGNSGYHTSYAVSPTLTGRYVKAYRPLITTGTVDGAVNGPGGADIDAVGGNVFLHGWLATGSRGMYRADLGWANDYPVVRGSRVRTEAERGTLHNARVRTNAVNASQAAVAAYIDYADSWVDLSVYVPRAGSYTVHVAYAAGYGDAQHTMTVNGGTQLVVNYPNTGWDSYRQVPVDVTMNAGWNTIRLQHRSRWAELDYIEVA
ncbi:hypothetical protein GCM10027280_51270 [Micromonospora polyrhachis]|uniref:CBM6 domain-containing protein n=1 Tax=Micromonospora polyrhachis TaxID=1282883 RepID=A0A7W7SWQ9_9ACTN|nr:family 43 glycosylhydrolase [Micromonospora polyrhachis]MBB4961961.1 hypothetical protein [Micromonospora polyrhachis]